MTNGRLPSTAKYTPNPATGNGAGSNAPGAKAGSAGRIRRDAPPQLLGRGQRNSSVGGMRSASLAGDSGIPHVAEPQPYGMLTIQESCV